MGGMTHSRRTLANMPNPFLRKGFVFVRPPVPNIPEQCSPKFANVRLPRNACATAISLPLMANKAKKLRCSLAFT